MLKPKSNALRVVEATLGKVNKVKKPVTKFIIHIVDLWLGMNCRYVFSNMGRWGEHTEKSYRNMFSKFFDWFEFNFLLMRQHCSPEVIAVFDPSYIKKSGKHTYGIGMFWSGVRQKALRGLEIGCLAFVDVVNATAMHAIAVQTPSPKNLKLSGKTLVRQGLHIITKARQDANLMYLYKAKQKSGKGRPKLYDGKVNIAAIDKRRIKCCYRDKGMEVYAAVLYCVQLKQKVLTAFVYYADKEQPEIIISTNTQIEAVTMLPDKLTAK